MLMKQKEVFRSDKSLGTFYPPIPHSFVLGDLGGMRKEGGKGEEIRCRIDLVTWHPKPCKIDLLDSLLIEIFQNNISVVLLNSLQLGTLTHSQWVLSSE